MRLIPRLHRRAPLEPADPKPLTVTIESIDGQHHVFALGLGDAIGYAGIRVDITELRDDHVSKLRISHFDDPNLTAEVADEISRRARTPA